MANIIRSAKSASDWTVNELAAYRVLVSHVDAVTFFGQPVPAAVHSLQAFLNHQIGEIHPNLSPQLLALCDKLDLTEQSPNDEVNIDLLCYLLLGALEFETPRICAHMQWRMPLRICGELCVAKTDVTLLAKPSPTLVLLVQESKTISSSKNPVPQLVAQAIAAFAANNAARVQRGLGPLDRMEFPGITTRGTRLTLHRVPVTRNLCIAVAQGIYPQEDTHVHSFIIPSANPTVGMGDRTYRRDAVEHLVAFRELARSLWEPFLR